MNTDIEQRLMREMPTPPPGYSVGKYFTEIYCQHLELLPLARIIAEALAEAEVTFAVKEIDGRLRLALSPLEGTIPAEGNA